MALTDLDKAIDAATAAITAPGGQLALGTANIRGADYPVFESAPQSLREYLAFFLATNGDKEFIVYQGERLTFADVQAQSVRIAAALQARHSSPALTLGGSAFIRTHHWRRRAARSIDSRFCSSASMLTFAIRRSPRLAARRWRTG